MDGPHAEPSCEPSSSSALFAAWASLHRHWPAAVSAAAADTVAGTAANTVHESMRPGLAQRLRGKLSLAGAKQALADGGRVVTSVASAAPQAWERVLKLAAF